MRPLCQSLVSSVLKQIATNEVYNKLWDINSIECPLSSLYFQYFCGFSPHAIHFICFYLIKPRQTLANKLKAELLTSTSNEEVLISPLSIKVKLSKCGVVCLSGLPIPGTKIV